MVVITAIHQVGGTGHEHIAEVRWKNPETSATGQSTTAEMVTYLNGNGRAQVHSGGKSAEVGVVNAKPPYIRTHADGVWTDNLLALPKY